MTAELILGTALTGNATRVLVLGSGELGKEVTIAFMRLGVEVHAADSYADAPAQQVAHFAHTLDMTDGQAVMDLIEQVRPHLVVPEIEAIATDALEVVERDGLARVIPTAAATGITMNRERIRRLAAEELGVATSPYEFASNYEQFCAAVERIGLPCVVKPVMSSSGKGQSVVRDPSEIPSAWEVAQSAGRVTAKRVIIEGFVDFDYEITLLTVRSRSGTSFCDPIGHRQQDGDYVESWQPAAMDPRALQGAQRIAQVVTSALGGWGLFGVEFFVRGEEVIFSELSPRPHDTGMVTMASQRFSEFDLHARAVLGLPVDTHRSWAAASAVIRAPEQVPREPHELSYSGLEKALECPGTDLRIFAKPKAKPRRRLGVVVATGEDVAQARQRASRAANEVKVNFRLP